MTKNNIQKKELIEKMSSLLSFNTDYNSYIILIILLVTIIFVIFIKMYIKRILLIKIIMANYKPRIFASILMLSLFLFSASLKSSLFSNFRNYMSQSLNSESDDEIGGSLLDIVSPSDASNSDLFENPEKPEPTKVLEPNLEAIIDQVNQPVVENKNITPPTQNYTSVNKTEEVSSSNNTSVNKTEEVSPPQNNTSVNKTEEVSASNNTSVNKTEEVAPSQNNTSVNKTEEASPSNNTSTNKTEEDSPSQNNTSVNKTEEVSPSNNTSTNKTEEASPSNNTELKKEQIALLNNTQVSAPEVGRLAAAYITNNTIKETIAPIEVKKMPVTNTQKLSRVSGSFTPLPTVNATPTTLNNIHAPYPMPETANMKYLSLISILIFGSTFLISRLIISLFKTREGSFFMKGIKLLCKQSLLYFFILSLLNIFYTFGVFDSVMINWEYLIASLSILGIGWFIFSVLIIIFCSMATFKWRDLELNSKDSFKSIKGKYENLADKSYQQKFDSSEIFELYEYLILKVYFCIPFYPVFKAYSLKREFKFHIYLSYCLLNKLRLFFKLTWTCWIITIFAFLSWSVFVAPLSIPIITLVLICFPILGLLVALLQYFYMKRIYRRVVQEVNKNNYLSFTDVEFNQNFAFENFKEYPVYLDEVFSRQLKAGQPRLNFHEHFHHRTPSMYEDQVIFGATGFSLLLNILQATGFTFVIWSVLLFVKYIGAITQYFGNSALAIAIPIFLVYLALYSYLLSISLRWYTIISSIEMKRNDKCVKKTINYHLKKAAEMSNSIFLIFKRLYFDIRMNQKEIDNFNSLGKVVCQNLVQISYMRFKKINEDIGIKKIGDKYPIDVDTELRAFLKSCGIYADDKEIEFMLHLVENYSDKEDTLTLEQLYDIWGAHIHFSSLPPEEILNYVFDEYFRRRDDIEPVLRGDSDGLNMEKIEHLCDFYNEYFTLDQVQFIKEETHYLGKNFSRDAFIQMMLAPRRYYPN